MSKVITQKMNLPLDIYHVMIPFFPVRELVKVRVVSSVFHEMAKIYKGKIRKHLGSSHNRLCRSFPNATYNLKETIVHEAYFDDYIKLESLCVNQYSSIVHEDAFRKLPDLKHLEIWSNHWDRNRIGVGGITFQVTTPMLTLPMFKHLSPLISLKLFSDYKITDEAFMYLVNLEELVLDHCTQITSAGIRNLKNLKRLHIHSQSLITDTAFGPDSMIESLYIHSNSSVTDQGILSLSKLKLLNTARTPYICGTGFKSLVHLEMLYLDGVFISDYSDLKGVSHLVLTDCILPHQNYEEWICLEYLRIDDTIINYPLAFLKLGSLPRLEQITIERCPVFFPYISRLEKTFQKKMKLSFAETR